MSFPTQTIPQYRDSGMALEGVIFLCTVSPSDYLSVIFIFIAMSWLV